MVSGGGLGVEPALQPGAHRLDLHRLGLARQPGAPLQAQEGLAIDLAPQQAFQCLPIDGTLEPQRHRLHRHMAVVVVPMVVMVMVMVMVVVVVDGLGVIDVVVGMVPLYVVIEIVTGLGRMGVVAMAVPSMAVIAMACIPLVAVQAQQQGRRHLAPGHGQHRDART